MKLYTIQTGSSEHNLVIVKIKKSIDTKLIRNIPLLTVVIQEKLMYLKSTNFSSFINDHIHSATTYAGETDYSKM